MQSIYSFCEKNNLQLHTTTPFGEVYQWITLPESFKGSKSQKKNAIKSAKIAVAKYLKDIEDEYNTLLNNPEKEYEYIYAPDLLYIKKQEEIKANQHLKVLEYITRCNNVLYLLENLKKILSHSEVLK